MSVSQDTLAKSEVRHRILMIQNQIVTSGTLLSISRRRRPPEGSVSFMEPNVWTAR